MFFFCVVRIENFIKFSFTYIFKSTNNLFEIVSNLRGLIHFTILPQHLDGENEEIPVQNISGMATLGQRISPRLCRIERSGTSFFVIG